MTLAEARTMPKINGQAMAYAYCEVNRTGCVRVDDTWLALLPFGKFIGNCLQFLASKSVRIIQL